MKLRDFIPPVATKIAGAIMRSFTSDFIRGRDIDDDAGRRPVLSKPFAQSAHINSAVSHVADEIAGRPLRFYEGDTEFEDAALAAWWEKPALGPTVLGMQNLLSRADVQHDMAAWDRLEGEWFLVFPDEWLLLSGRAKGAALPPFFLANPQRMAAVVQASTLLGWRYTDAGGRQMTLLPQQVRYHKTFNPYDDWRGLGKLQAAAIAAEGAFLTGVYIRDLARNNGDQGMVVIAKSGVVTEPQREQILADLRAKRAALARGIVKDLLLGGEITVDRPKEQAASGELMTSKTLSHEEIFLAFGVPPSMTAVKAAYSVGKDSDYYQLITRTCQPLGQKIAATFAAIASFQAGRSLTAELDWDDHPVMIEVRNGRIESASKLWGMGMPLKDSNDFLGLGMKPFPGWEIGYINFSVAPVGDGQSTTPAANPTQDPALAEPIVSDPDVEQLRLLVMMRQRAKRVCVDVTPKSSGDPFAAFACTCGSGEPVTKARSEKELAQWRTLMSKRRETVRSFQNAFGRLLMKARAETLRKIETIGAKGIVLAAKAGDPLVDAVAQKAAAADFLFDLAKFADAFTATMRDRQKAALDTAGNQLLAEVGKDDAFAFPPERVLDFLAGRQNKLRDVPKSVFEEIKAAIEEGLLKGETTPQLADRVRGAFNGVSSERALRIAMTETSAAYGAGRAAAMEQAGVQWKKWLTSGNANVRAAHAEANGQTVPVDSFFIVDGEHLEFPGDDSGSPGNVINCHCVSVASSEGPAE